MTKFSRKQFVGKKNYSSNGGGGERMRLRSMSLHLLLLGLVIAAGFSYLYLINLTATGGFDIKGTENEIEQLAKDNKELELKAAELQSLVTIEAASQELELVATTQIEYLPAVGTAVAVR